MSGATVEVLLDRDEWWPVYSLVPEDAPSAKYGVRVAIPVELKERLEAAEAEFEAVQEALHAVAVKSRKWGAGA